MVRASILIAGLIVLATSAGCSLCPDCRSANVASCAATTAPALSPVERKPLEPELLLLASSLHPVDPPIDPQPAISYRALSLEQCQCLAARNAPTADSLDRQRRKLQKQRENASCLSDPKSEKQRAFQESMLLYSALEIRDQFADAALEWYFQLAGAEAEADLLGSALVRARDTLARIEHLKKQGIRLPAPIEEYQRQILSLRLRQARNQLTIEQLNGKLRQALAFDADSTWRFQPDPSTPVGTETVADVEAAVRLGLAQRPHLLLLREMIAHLDEDTLAAARALLSSINPLLGLPAPKSARKALTMSGKILHIQPGQPAEVEAVRAQLVETLKERERAAAAEIREAAYEVRVQRELTFLAGEAAHRWRERIEDLEKQQTQGMPVFSDLNMAYIELDKVRGEVVKEFLGWKIAAVKVKRAQGILPAECGYSDGLPCGSPIRP